MITETGIVSQVRLVWQLLGNGTGKVFGKIRLRRIQLDLTRLKSRMMCDSAKGRCPNMQFLGSLVALRHSGGCEMDMVHKEKTSQNWTNRRAIMCEGAEVVIIEDYRRVLEEWWVLELLMRAREVTESRQDVVLRCPAGHRLESGRFGTW